MGKPGGYRPRARGPAPPEDPAVLLHRYAVKLFDKGDGRAVDWPMVAAMLFKTGFACWDEAGRSNRAMQVLRRVEAHVYDRQAGNVPEHGTPYTTDPLPRPPVGPAPELSPGRDRSH